MDRFDEEVRRNIWSYYDDNYYIVIPTNGQVNAAGDAVMGRGLARQAASRFRSIPAMLGQKLQTDGNHVYAWPELRFYTFPVKEHWKDEASLELIERSARELIKKAEHIGKFPVYIPRVGCGNGKCKWEDVKPILLRTLDARFISVYEEGHDGY